MKRLVRKAVYLKEYVFMCCFLSRIFFFESGLPCIFLNPGYYAGLLGQVVTSFDSEISQGGQSIGSCG